ncbi:hypothetical protein [Capnocytophaga canimorsus]|uniref:hypothetical protein n=1 Tax=Capnocytophaga canimorsus TaxID=28188 RepID=UPI0037D0BC65
MKKKKFDFSKVLEFLKKYQHYFMASAFILFVYLIVKSLFFGKKDKPNTDVKDAPPVDTKGSKMTIVEARAKSERLLLAMNSPAGTDEEEIQRVLRGISKSDYNMIYEAFGLRSYNRVLGESALFDFLGVDLDLTQWLMHELSASEMNELRRLNPNLPI